MLAILIVISDNEKENINKLLIRLGKGDTEALTGIYELCGGRMMSVACGIVKNRAMAEDIVQDCFIKIVSSAEQFRVKDNGYGWICTIVRNTALNAIKKENLRQGADIDSFYNLSDNFNLTDDREKALLVESAMAVLDKREKTVIWLRYFNDMTVREIAKETDISKSTVADIIKNAEDKMKNVLNKPDNITR